MKTIRKATGTREKKDHGQMGSLMGGEQWGQKWGGPAAAEWAAAAGGAGCEWGARWGGQQQQVGLGVNGGPDGGGSSSRRLLPPYLGNAIVECVGPEQLLGVGRGFA